MKKTGEILKKAREEKGLSIHEIGLSLKISSKVLKAIENGDESQLPAKTFLRGFVQSYANFLHLESEKVLEVFYEEVGSTRPTPYIRPTETEKSQAPSPSMDSTTDGTSEASVTPIRKNTNTTSGVNADGMESLKENKSAKTLGIIAAALVLIGLIIFTKRMIDKYSKEAEVPSSEVAQTMEGATPVIADSPVVLDPEAEVSTEMQTPIVGALPAQELPVAVSSPSPATSPLPTMSPISTPTPTLTPTPISTPVASAAAEALPSPTLTPAPSPSPSPSPSPAEKANKPVELIVEAYDTVEIEYSAPNGKPQKIRLSAEQVHTFKSKSGLKISFSNGGAVNLIVNGKDIGLPGDLGKPITLSY